MIKNKGFEYVKTRHMYYEPKTPFAALRAAEEGLLPPEAFIYKAAAIEPIFDHPDNLEEIERILGQKGRDLETNLLLVNLLNKLIKNPDKEIALFAAESINAIENDYSQAVENLKENQYRKRAELYSEMAELNKAVTDLWNFYLREAFTSYRQLDKAEGLNPVDHLNMSRILIKLNLLSQAKNIIRDNNIKGIDAGFILAEIAYRQRNFNELYRIMNEFKKLRSRMDSNQTLIIDFWTEGT